MTKWVSSILRALTFNLAEYCMLYITHDLTGLQGIEKSKKNITANRCFHYAEMNLKEEHTLYIL